MEKYLTVKDISELLQVSKATVYWWVRKGKLHGFRPSGKKRGTLRFRFEDVEELRSSGSQV